MNPSEQRRQRREQVAEAFRLEWRRDPQSALDRLYRAEDEALRRWLERRLDNPEHAEDVAQDAWCTLAVRLDTYRPEHTPQAWLYGIADVLSARLRTEIEERAMMKRISQEQTLASPEPLPSDSLETLNLRVKLEALLSSFSPEERDLIGLHLDLGLTFAEIASMRRWRKHTAEALKKKMQRLSPELRGRALRLGLADLIDWGGGQDPRTP